MLLLDFITFASLLFIKNHEKISHFINGCIDVDRGF